MQLNNLSLIGMIWSNCPVFTDFMPFVVSTQFHHFRVAETYKVDILSTITTFFLRTRPYFTDALIGHWSVIQ